MRAPQSVWQGYATKCLPLNGIYEVRLEVGFMCLPHGLRDLCMIRLWLLSLNWYGSRVINILIESVCNIGWCIVRRQAIWWEGMHVLNLHRIGATRTS